MTTHLAGWLKWKTGTTLNACEDTKKLDHLYTANGNVKLHSHARKHLAVS